MPGSVWLAMNAECRQRTALHFGVPLPILSASFNTPEQCSRHATIGDSLLGFVSLIVLERYGYATSGDLTVTKQRYVCNDHLKDYFLRHVIRQMLTCNAHRVADLYEACLWISYSVQVQGEDSMQRVLALAKDLIEWINVHKGIGNMPNPKLRIESSMGSAMQLVSLVAPAAAAANPYGTSSTATCVLSRALYALRVVAETDRYVRAFLEQIPLLSFEHMMKPEMTASVMSRFIVVGGGEGGPRGRKEDDTKTKAPSSWRQVFRFTPSADVASPKNSSSSHSRPAQVFSWWTRSSATTSVPVFPCCALPAATIDGEYFSLFPCRNASDDIAANVRWHKGFPVEGRKTKTSAKNASLPVSWSCCNAPLVEIMPAPLMYRVLPESANGCVGGGASTATGSPESHQAPPLAVDSVSTARPPSAVQLEEVGSFCDDVSARHISDSSPHLATEPRPPPSASGSPAFFFIVDDTKCDGQRDGAPSTRAAAVAAAASAPPLMAGAPSITSAPSGTSSAAIATTEPPRSPMAVGSKRPRAADEEFIEV